MKNIYISIILFSILISISISGQSVSTFASITTAFGDGMVVSAQGDLYVAGGYNKNNILKITNTGEVSNFVSGLPGPVGPGFDSKGNMYVTNYSGNSISKITPDLTITQFWSGLDGPAGLYINNEDEIFVSLYGANFSGIGRSIIKFADSTESTFLFGNGIKDAIGLTFDEDGNGYATNYNGGKIYKIDTSKNVTLLATISGAQINQIAYAKGYIYIPCQNLRKIYRVSKDGSLEHFAGSGTKGTDDGPLLSATFDFPNSIAVSPTGDSLYILDGNLGKIRLIDFSSATSVKTESNNPNGFELEQNYPNPFNPTTIINYSITAPNNVKLIVYNAIGMEILSLVNEYKTAGHYSIEFNANDLSSGVYFYKITSGNNLKIKKMILVK